MSERIPAYEGREPYIFVSYAHRNSEKVMPVIEALFSEKYRLWYDEGIAPGSDWPKNIEDHLRAAAAVLVFVSEESLISPNCENEVVHAGMESRPVYQFTLGDKVHPKLSECETVKDYAGLRALLDDSLIGDGVTGYERGVGTAKKGNFWSAIIAVAACLIIALGAGVYGLNNGWFDNMLPGLAPVPLAAQPEPKEVVHMGSNVITHGIFEQTNQKLTEEIVFESDKTREMLYDAVGFYDWGQETPLTYENLTTWFNDEIWLDDCNEELLKYMQYFPQLRKIFITGGELETLEPLLYCAELETVCLKTNVFPVEIPEHAPFTVEVMN